LQQKADVDALKSVYIASPTAKNTNMLLHIIGFSQFIKAPISFQISDECPMAVDWTGIQWCRNDVDGIITAPFPINEGLYYAAMTSIVPKFLIGTPSSGYNVTAKNIYLDARFSTTSGLSFNSGCAPELNTRSELGYPGFNGKLKSWDNIMFEEVVQYVTIAMMLESYFSVRIYGGDNVFYSSPPCGYGIVGYGPCGTLLSVEMIGCIVLLVYLQAFLPAIKRSRQCY
jgi:hypothetical protein